MSMKVPSHPPSPRTTGNKSKNRYDGTKGQQTSSCPAVPAKLDHFDSRPPTLGSPHRKPTARPAFSTNGSSNSAKIISNPPWAQSYPETASKRGPDDPKSDLLPKKGTQQRAILQPVLEEIVNISVSNTLPCYEKAIIHPNKTFGYLLRSDHKEGKSKAKLFEQMGFRTMSLEERNYAERSWRESGKNLIVQIRNGLKENVVDSSEIMDYGVSMTVCMDIKGPNGATENIKTVWLYGYKVVDGEGKLSNRPALTSAYKDPTRRRNPGKNKEKLP